MTEKREIQPKHKKPFQRILVQGFLLTILCLLLGLIDGLRSYVSAYSNGVFYLDLDVALRWDVSGWLIWIPLIPFVFWLSRRFPLDRNNWRLGLLIFLPVGLLLALARAFFPALVQVVFFDGYDEMRQWLPNRFYILITDFLIAFAFYTLVLTFGQAINYYKRYREEELRTSQLEAQLSKAQLDALKMQLHPHFLFNALNSISALQMESTEAAQEMTARLGDFLRMTLENVGTSEVTLKREIEFLECYLDIEKVRFGRRLTTNIEIAPEVLNCRVPNLILQPLVENAIRHGIAPNAAAGQINIRAARENGWLKITVADNGKGIENDKLNKILTSGLGLSNTQARLEQLYGANFRFELQNAKKGGLLATLNLPHKQGRSEEIFN
ncbi:MAG: histidine kinase [Acidobacteriota bacterium]|nr:histidine kinase [Acidobacteriota bacterium]